MDNEYDNAYYAEIQRKKMIIKRYFLIFIVVLSISGIGAWLFFLPHQSGSNAILGSSTDLTDKQIIQRAGSHMVLPPGETPKIVTVTNVNDMKKTQPFFNIASNGDKLLIYSTKVILYSVKADRILDIAQIHYSPDEQK
jgi:hypothetical protein